MMNEIIVLIPSLDPDHKLIRTVESLIGEGFSKILLVNDGSKKENLHIFDELAMHNEVSVIGYEKNQGKGYALKYGFKHVLENFPDAKGVLTADGDGQHLAFDCMKTAEAMLKRDEIVLGCRNFKDPSVPKRNKAGNTISIFVYNFLCGIKLSDTQTGLRAIPARYLEPFAYVEGNRFEYETNTLLYMKKNNISFSEVSISTVYEEDSNQGSHFKVVSDSIKIYKPLLKFGGPMLLKFICGSLLSTLIDLGCFTLLTWLLDKLFAKKAEPDFLAIIGSVFIAGFIARVLSSLFNYTFNRNAVFKDKKSAKHTILKYYVLAALIFGASTIAVSAISFIFGKHGIAKTIIKFIVDALLFIISYKVQREWVFK